MFDVVKNRLNQNQTESKPGGHIECHQKAAAWSSPA